MLKIISWKIWYSNKTFDSTQGSWKEAPDNDVQIIVFYFDKKDGLGRPTRRIMSGNDYYSLDEDENFYESFDDISKVKGHVKYGKWTNDDNIKKIIKESADDYGEGWLFSVEPAKIIVKSDRDYPLRTTIKREDFIA